MHSGLPEFVDERAQMVWPAVADHQISAGDRRRDGISSRFDAIWDNPVRGSVQALHATDTDYRSARAFNLRTHLREKIREIDHFWLSGGVFENGFALGKGGG